MNQQPPIKLGPGGDYVTEEWESDNRACIAVMAFVAVVLVVLALV